jgi:hypothetical protein
LLRCNVGAQTIRAPIQKLNRPQQGLSEAALIWRDLFYGFAKAAAG